MTKHCIAPPAFFYSYTTTCQPLLFRYSAKSRSIEAFRSAKSSVHNL